ncbi:Hypothetical protein CAP_8582 [Chondromyces apiculatus DSM 436]|uniref:Uncharacterized protein n=1 Tax=Chondromyces apiculatus DSM 436 TaxID=1192034 RepID=A0A017SW27_9BACT|nr:Hypothetical protein CAP_8582 [Chondromyces apiculatus DSM 436]
MRTFRPRPGPMRSSATWGGPSPSRLRGACIPAKDQGPTGPGTMPRRAVLQTSEQHGLQSSSSC